MDIIEVMEWLMKNAYLYTTSKNGFILQPKFKKDLDMAMKKAKFTTPQKTKPTVETPNSLEVIKKKAEFPVPADYNKYIYTDWVDFYQNFISICKVPDHLESTNNNTYSGNKYTEDGMKAFQKALKEGYRYDVLCLAVSLYYKSSIRWKKSIGNYMMSGEWRSDYSELLDKANSGKGELDKHIKNTIDDGTGTNYEFG